MRRSFSAASAAVVVCLVVPPVWAQGAQPRPKVLAKVSAERMKALTVPEGEFHCKGPTGTGSLKFVKCTDIPVIVLLKPGGTGCIVHVPYHDLVVHSKKAETRITWNLIAPNDYKFSQANGIEFRAPGLVFQRVGPTSGDTKYSWKVVANAAAASL